MSIQITFISVMLLRYIVANVKSIGCLFLRFVAQLNKSRTVNCLIKTQLHAVHRSFPTDIRGNINTEAQHNIAIKISLLHVKRSSSAYGIIN